MDPKFRGSRPSGAVATPGTTRPIGSPSPPFRDRDADLRPSRPFVNPAFSAKGSDETAAA